MKQIRKEETKKRGTGRRWIMELIALLLVIAAAIYLPLGEEAEAWKDNYKTATASKYTDYYVDGLKNLKGTTVKSSFFPGENSLIAVPGSRGGLYQGRITETVTERTFPLRKLMGFFPFLNSRSKTNHYANSNADDALTFDTDRELSLDTAFDRMGVTGDEGSVTTWYHVNSKDDFEYMMSLASEDEGVKILLGYTLENCYDGTKLMHYISSGGETEGLDRLVGPGYVGGSGTSSTDANKALYAKMTSDGFSTVSSISSAGWYLFKGTQFLGSTYVLNGDYSYSSDAITNKYFNSIEAVPDFLVTRTTPASFILHADTTNMVRLETMSGTEGSGKYLSLYDAENVPFSQTASGTSLYDSTKKEYTYDSTKWVNKFYPEVYETEEAKSEKSADCAFYIQYETKSNTLRFFQIGRNETELEINNTLTKKRGSTYGYSRQYKATYALNLERTDTADEYKVQDLQWITVEMSRDHSTPYSTITHSAVFDDMTFYTCLAGTEFGWSAIGFPSTSDPEVVKKSTPSFTVKQKIVTGTGSNYRQVPTWLYCDNVTYGKFGQLLYLYGYESVPKEYILGMNPEQDTFYTNFDIWYGIDGIPKSMLAEGAGDTGVTTKSPAKEEVNPEDAVAETIVSGADIYVGSKSENADAVGHFYSTKANTVLYIPSEQTIEISEDGVFVVASNSVVILQGNIINRGNIIVQPGGVITYLQESDSLCTHCSIINTGGSMLIRDGGKVRVRSILTSVAEDTDLTTYYLNNKTNAGNADFLKNFLKYHKAGTNKSTLDIRGTVLVTYYMGLYQGTDVKIGDSGYLGMKDFKDTDLNDMFSLTAAEWASKATTSTYEKFTWAAACYIDSGVLSSLSGNTKFHYTGKID